MSAPKTLKVLYPLHPKVELLDFAGPYEILTHALYRDASLPLFTSTIASIEPTVTTSQNCAFNRHISLSEAYSNLASYDVIVIPGGGVADAGGVLENQLEPLGLVKAYANLPKREDGSVRTILSVCTGSLILAEAGVLDGLSATTHPYYFEKFQEVSARKGKTELLKERFVVNKVDGKKGLRIVTGGGVSSGMDATLWLIEEIAGLESAEKVAEIVQYARRQGVVL